MQRRGGGATHVDVCLSQHPVHHAKMMTQKRYGTTAANPSTTLCRLHKSTGKAFCFVFCLTQSVARPGVCTRVCVCTRASSLLTLVWHHSIPRHAGRRRSCRRRDAHHSAAWSDIASQDAKKPLEEHDLPGEFTHDDRSSCGKRRPMRASTHTSAHHNHTVLLAFIPHLHCASA